jgi:hypothetical protein
MEEMQHSPGLWTGKGNPQSPIILDLSSKSGIPSYNYLVDLKAQSKNPEKNHPVQFGSSQNFRGKNMLEYEPQTG